MHQERHKAKLRDVLVRDRTLAEALHESALFQADGHETTGIIRYSFTLHCLFFLQTLKENDHTAVIYVQVHSRLISMH